MQDKSEFHSAILGMLPSNPPLPPLLVFHASFESLPTRRISILIVPCMLVRAFLLTMYTVLAWMRVLTLADR